MKTTIAQAFAWGLIPDQDPYDEGFSDALVNRWAAPAFTDKDYFAYMAGHSAAETALRLRWIDRAASASQPVVS